jgi:hypothetical protein
MGELILICPATGKKVATGIEIDSVLGTVTRNRMTRRCPHCGARHPLRKPDATVVDVIVQRRLVNASDAARAANRS